MGPQVVVKVSPAGSVVIDAQGFKGSACTKATEQLHVVLGGGNPVSTKKKPDFFATNTSGVKVQGR